MDRAAHACHDQQHQQAQRVQPQSKIDMQISNRQPRHQNVRLSFAARHHEQDQAEDESQYNRADGEPRAEVPALQSKKRDRDSRE